jgi:hypothetical protein
MGINPARKQQNSVCRYILQEFNRSKLRWDTVPSLTYPVNTMCLTKGEAKQNLDLLERYDKLAGVVNSFRIKTIKI